MYYNEITSVSLYGYDYLSKNCIRLEGKDHSHSQSNFIKLRQMRERKRKTEYDHEDDNIDQTSTIERPL